MCCQTNVGKLYCLEQIRKEMKLESLSKTNTNLGHKYKIANNLRGLFTYYVCYQGGGGAISDIFGQGEEGAIWLAVCGKYLMGCLSVLPIYEEKLLTDLSSKSGKNVRLKKQFSQIWFLGHKIFCVRKKLTSSK